MKKLLTLLLLGLILVSCNTPKTNLANITFVNRSGLIETISTPERLISYTDTNFSKPQPYKKILRVNKRDKRGNVTSFLTTYHDNGQLYQYLEIVNGQACGKYEEHHPNGKLKLTSIVIAGTADINEMAEESWLFDRQSSVWDENSNLIAEYFYEKGLLQNNTTYYYPDGKIKKIVPYLNNLIEGNVQEFSNTGTVTSTKSYSKGVENGPHIKYWKDDLTAANETYSQGLLQEAKYYDQSGKEISSVTKGEGFQVIFNDDNTIKEQQIRNGLLDGPIKFFDNDNNLIRVCNVHNGKKNGEEIVYSNTKPSLAINWHDDKIQGEVKTWYHNGQIESLREMNSNKKHGISTAWYENGELMLVEEYDNDNLIRGEYYKKGVKQPISKISKGKGTATLFNSTGHFLKKINYHDGQPIS